MSGQFKNGLFFVENEEIKIGSSILVEYKDFQENGKVIRGHDDDIYVQWQNNTFTLLRDVIAEMSIIEIK